MLHLDQFYILVSEQAVTYREDAMTVARHLWKDQMQFRYDCVSAASHSKTQVHTQVNQGTTKLAYWVIIK